MSLINTWILAMKVFLISAGAFLVGMVIKESVPPAVIDAPAVWSVILCWMKPPYLLIIVNGIIATIVAASRFQENRETEPLIQGDRHMISVRSPPPVEFAVYAAEPEVKNVMEERRSAVVVYESGDRVVELKPVMVNGSRVDGSVDEEEARSDFDSDADDESNDGLFPDSTSASTPERIPSEFQLEYYHPSPADEPPPVPSRRSSNRRKSGRKNSKAPRKLVKHETFESVWKKIMEAREEPLSNNDDSPAASYVLRPEPSPSEDDELNRRIEDFINKMNHEMRQQRQRSLERHMNKLGSWSHT